MKKTALMAFLTLAACFAGMAQVVTSGHSQLVKPVNTNPVAGVNMPTLQDTLTMLMNRIKQLEDQKVAGGKKTIRTIVPSAENMCLPYKDSKFPSQTFFQGVVVDDALCNNNPDAVLIVTVKTTTPRQAFPVTVSYDAAAGKWQIVFQGFYVSSLAKNVQCYNFGGKEQGMCPQSGLYNDVGVMSPVTLSPDYNNNLSFNVLIAEKPEYPLPKIKRKL